jgi:hypothetical protein
MREKPDKLAPARSKLANAVFEDWLRRWKLALEQAVVEVNPDLAEEPSTNPRAA